ncbi:hypothetical protein TBR22_A15790 [Luteitalea sp. TBR-22]|uniref:DUF6265 family protein n=1 Tax=Luteitalea sp. TBR-22 TaxID=2802971 RepID=UPI001AF7F07E|nr:DUF6265 family protein [Luteitalea sp. TBR-22]BCS32369.1 hypothetical protein TBR22_A15790 [Luteitalea sp. TBR-22]
MTTGHACLLLMFTLVCSAAGLQAQEKVTERTVKLAAGAQPPQATISDVAWLEGRWAGSALGGETEEIWSGPKAGAMMGMYRLVREGKVVFYEMQALVEEGGSLVLRLKHFHANLAGWEEKATTVDFPLVALRDGVVQFEGMSMHRDGADKLIVYLAIQARDGTVREETFRYTKVRPPMP